MNGNNTGTAADYAQSSADDAHREVRRLRLLVRRLAEMIKLIMVIKGVTDPLVQQEVNQVIKELQG